jgi:hypothetical protein
VEIKLDIGHRVLCHVHESNGHEFPEIIFWGDGWKGKSWHVARLDEEERWQLSDEEPISDVDVLRYVPRSLHWWLHEVAAEAPVLL